MSRSTKIRKPKEFAHRGFHVWCKTHAYDAVISKESQARLMLVMVLMMMMMMVMMKFMVCHDALRQQTPEFPNALLNSARFWRTILGLKFPSSHSYRMIYSTSRWSYSNNIDHYSVITPLENKHVPSNTVVGRLLFIWNGPLVFMGVSPSSKNCRCTSSWLARASMKLSRCVSRDETDGFICFWFLKGDSRKKSWVTPSTVVEWKMVAFER